ncbi:S-methyl-5-thioribose-1-phosphate isomerase [Mycoemilia scoparia]|uniref:Methylthioribose-1-phosphate isomerase n=1 Tax=Mycoemilia scoparia TaxID=417184 RepID=A0A9W7ZY75_9FUNG|nr:S-methyl-5-thioribose-1-phosphate isomerase [Mycoemilia scoparia]
MGGAFTAIRWENPYLEIVDQLLLPHKIAHIPIRNSEDGHKAIVTMQTRGAPAIAIVAALSLAAELLALPKEYFKTAADASDYIISKLKYLSTSRPTAVNLFDAVNKLTAVVTKAIETDDSVSPQDIVKAYINSSEAMLEADISDNKAIGKHGAKYLINRNTSESTHQKFKVLTHCNTGSLATAGYGTALGIIRSLNEDGALSHAFCTETRPYNQGSRLTAFELQQDNIPSTLVCDSAVSFLLKQNPDIRAIVVGADRVAANGDTANKIGTYQLALAAKAHNIDFIVAAPTTSIDLNITNGDQIIVEQRKSTEVTCVSGKLLIGPEDDNTKTNGEAEQQPQLLAVRVAPQGVSVWNPSFDVTPAELITAVVTEKGVITDLPNLKKEVESKS